MSSLRILAPVLVDFHLVPGTHTRDAAAYGQFWTTAEDRWGKKGSEAPDLPANLTFPHAGAKEAVHLYRTIADYAGSSAPHVFSGDVRLENLGLTEAQRAPLLAAGTTVHFDVFDHGIMLLDVVIPLKDFRTDRPLSVVDNLNLLETHATEAGEDLSRAIQSQILTPLLKDLRDLQERQGGHVITDRDPHLCTTEEAGTPLWATRSLYLPREDPEAATALRHWLRNVDAKGSATAEDLIAGRATSNVTFVNYAFTTSEPTGPGTEQHNEWEGLRHAQYFYAALDRVDSLLAKVLGETAEDGAHERVKFLRSQLTLLSHRAELIVMDRQRVSKYLPRGVRATMDRILTGWEHDELVELPVQFKLDVCQRHMDELERRRSAKASTVTDLILLCIGITSVLATAIALTDFGRTIALDPRSTGMGGGNLVTWVSSQPPDAILLASGVISVAAVAVYLFFRSDTQP